MIVFASIIHSYIEIPQTTKFSFSKPENSVYRNKKKWVLLSYIRKLAKQNKNRDLGLLINSGKPSFSVPKLMYIWQWKWKWTDNRTLHVLYPSNQMYLRHSSLSFLRAELVVAFYKTADLHPVTKLYKREQNTRLKFQILTSSQNSAFNKIV